MVEGRRQTLDALPRQWFPALLAIGRNKQPISPRTGNALADWPFSPAPSIEQLLSVPAVGLRTGRISSTLCFDFDGPESWTTFRAVFGGTPEQVLPPTIAWTSGKPQRCQMAFAIAVEDQPLLSSKKRRVGTLELRWEGVQSVLMGHHPETGSYRWLPGRAPYEIELATLPRAVIEAMPSRAFAQRRAAPVQQHHGLTVPLEAFVTARSAWLIKNGSVAGECNSDGIRLALDLVAAERWLMTQGVGVERDAQALFDEYVSHCPERINGKPFDHRAAQARFDGAVRLNPTPPTPEEKLAERLAYQRRMAHRAARREVLA